MNYSNIFKIYIFITILSLVGISSCSDFFIKELEIPRQEIDDQLVVHGFISDIDTALHFTIAKNFGLDDNFAEKESRINSASVNISKGGELLYHIEQNELSKYYSIFLENRFGNKGETFQFEFIHPEYDKAHVEATMPHFVEPESIRFIPDFILGGPDDQGKQHAIEISFTDPPDEENYYEIHIPRIIVDSTEFIFGEDTFVYYQAFPDNYYSRSPLIDRGISGVLLSDQTFNGSSHTFKIILDGDEDLDTIPVDKLAISWSCITKDHFEYAKSLLKYQNSKDFGLFTDPIAVYSNIENGLGIISLRSTKILAVEEE